MDIQKETMDLIQALMNIVREEQTMRADLQTRIAALEMKQLADDVIVEMPRLQAAMSAKEI